MAAIGQGRGSRSVTGMIAGVAARALLMLLLLVLVTTAIRAFDAQASGALAISDHVAAWEGSPNDTVHNISSN